MRKQPALLVLLLGLVGCDSPASDRGRAAPTGSRTSLVDIVAAPATGSVASIVQKEMKRADDEGRDLVIYVGAEWCEPCKHFHDAAASGALDSEFPTLRLLEFDRDRDEQRLHAADCITSLIPLFARPTSDGHCDARKRIMGGIKGKGTIRFISDRLKSMLELR